MEEQLENRIRVLEQTVDQLRELMKAVIHELPDDVQARLAWKLVNNWIEQGGKQK